MTGNHAAGVEQPLGLLAELTYRCPLACPYCSNPVNLDAYSQEMETERWCDVLDQAEALGVLQLHLSGGEPLMRRDLPTIAAQGSRLGMYINLVTSGIGLTAAVAETLAAAGVDHVQLSVQDASAAESDAIAGSRSFGQKMTAARAVSAAGLPLTVNVVLHRANIGSIPLLVDLAIRLGAQRLELANVQFYGWAFANQRSLMPTRTQVTAADSAVRHARASIGDGLEINYVMADYFSGYPKPCMQGWGRRQLIVAPDGTVLPCPAANVIPDLRPWNVRDKSLGDAWYHSPAFMRFRGTEWMQEPCASCVRRADDFGGCRCQTYLLTGHSDATDPACTLSPDHHLLDAAKGTAEGIAAGAAPARRPHAPRPGDDPSFHRHSNPPGPVHPDLLR
jgi:pyrroloquinoline quinone biosynthesis protein E